MPIWTFPMYFDTPNIHATSMKVKETLPSSETLSVGVTLV